MTRLVLPASSLLLASLLAGGAFGQTEREHGSHVHGRSEIKLAVDSGAFELVLTAPGADIVGFEHVPADAAQQAMIDAALSRLNDAGGWLRLEPTDTCRIDETDAHTHGFKATNEDGTDHDEHGSHGHGHEHGDGVSHDHSHAEFHVTVKGHCTAMPAFVLIDLHQSFANIDLIVVESITETSQNRVELRAGQNRVDLD